ncbi:MAG: TolC family outer membrane protein [Paracoccaceae bacterium]
MKIRPQKAFELFAASAMALVLSGPVVQAETLGDALVSAYRTSGLLKQNQAVLRAADEDVASSIATLRPVISYVASGQYAKSNIGLTRNGTQALSLDWTLYDFGRSQAGVAIARETVLATRQALIGVEQDVLLTAVRAYMDVRRSAQNVTIQRNSVNVIEEQLGAANDRFSLGEITKTDVALAEARLAAAKAALAAARGDLEVARASYKAVMGHEWDGRTNSPARPAFPMTLAEAQALAQKLHPAVRQAQHQAKVADLQVELAKAQHRPSINLNISGFESDSATVPDSSAALQLTQPLFTGGKIASGERKAIAGRDAARAALTLTSVNVAQQVAVSWAAVDVARAQIAATNQQIAAAQSAYDGTKEEAELGARTTLDVLDAQRELLSAQSDRTAAEANLQVAFYALMSSMGLLTAEHLKLGVPLYDPEAYYDVVKKAPISSQGAKLDKVLKAIGAD